MNCSASFCKCSWRIAARGQAKEETSMNKTIRRSELAFGQGVAEGWPGTELGKVRLLQYVSWQFMLRA